MPIASWPEMRDMLVKARETLAGAPHKHRIDFQPYWDWYDGDRAQMVEEITALLPHDTEEQR
jgi:hypothetical protein